MYRAVLDSTLVHAGYQTSVKNIQLASLNTIAEDDFTKWGLPVNSALLTKVRAEHSAAMAVDVNTFGTGAVPAARPVALPSAVQPAGGPVIEAGPDRTSPGYGPSRKIYD